MKTTLRFFENNNISKIGFLRGLYIYIFTTISTIIINYLLLLSINYHKIYKIKYKFISISLFISLILCSCLGVQDTNNINEAIVYSTMIYLVIYIIILSIVSLYHFNWYLLPILLLSIGFGSINGYILYNIGPKYPN